jgi:SEC-C motif-containing protein
MAHQGTDPCPCGSERSLAACCGRFISGGQWPLRAEELMRSRYSAYVLGELDYLMQTHDPATASQAVRASAARWMKEAQWRGLEVVATERGEGGDDEGMVEFKARYVTREGSAVHHERSGFRRIEGRWVYVDGAAGEAAPSRSGPKPGRNEPCWCGSGKKYKKCCGA